MSRYKRILSALIALTMLTAGAVQAAGGQQETTPVQAEVSQQSGRFEMPSFDLPADAAVLIAQDTGDLLYQKNPDAGCRSPALPRCDPAAHL